MKTKKINKITIIGVGLIGGSMGLAIRSKELAHEIVGVGRHRGSINKAVKLKAVDWGTLDIKKGVEGADVVVLAVPILSMVRLVEKSLPHLKKGCILTDVGSTKFKIVKKIEMLLPDEIFFIGSHPMAGSEERGVEKADKDLFKNSLCILTKTKKTNTSALEVMKGLWAALGAKVILLSPKVHDRIASEVSHLPHMVIFSMLNSVSKRNLKFASSGFYDATRIASSDAKIWKDIAISNRDEILKSIAKFKKGISTLEKAINKKDRAILLRIFKKAKEKRELLTDIDFYDNRHRRTGR